MVLCSAKNISWLLRAVCNLLTSCFPYGSSWAHTKIQLSGFSSCNDGNCSMEEYLHPPRCSRLLRCGSFGSFYITQLTHMMCHPRHAAYIWICTEWLHIGQLAQLTSRIQPYQRNNCCIRSKIRRVAGLGCCSPTVLYLYPPNFYPPHATDVSWLSCKSARSVGEPPSENQP